MIIDQNGNIDITGNVTTLKALAVPAPGTPEKLNVDGRINLRDNGGWGRLMVEYDAGTQGYYAVYAP